MIWLWYPTWNVVFIILCGDTKDGINNAIFSRLFLPRIFVFDNLRQQGSCMRKSWHEISKWYFHSWKWKFCPWEDVFASAIFMGHLFSCMEISFSCMEISFSCMEISFFIHEKNSFSCMHENFMPQFYMHETFCIVARLKPTTQASGQVLSCFYHQNVVGHIESYVTKS